MDVVGPPVRKFAAFTAGSKDKLWKPCGTWPAGRGLI
jgi:hypothetical protein